MKGWPLRKRPLRTILEDELYACCFELVEAHSATEAWKARLVMLQQREKRIQGQLGELERKVTQ